MAQIAIPVLLLGAAYLISNDKDKKESEEKEGFSDINNKKNNGNLLANENKTYYPNISQTTVNTNNEGTYSNYQDKYF